MRTLVLVFLALLLGQQNLSAQKTVKIWIVRHAEKLADNPKDNDPDLSPEGKVRADDLFKYLKGQKLDSIFTTGYKRSKLTAFQLADRQGISLKTYSPNYQKELAKQLMANAKGKKILIVGHSNTVLELIEAFGGTRPVKELTDDDYDYIFSLTVKDGKTDVSVDHFGAEHHTKQEPAAKPKS